MEIVITKFEKVSIDPLKVIEELYETEVGYGYLDKSCEGKYFKVFTDSPFSRSEEIDKETYKYIKALETILNYLK